MKVFWQAHCGQILLGVTMVLIPAPWCWILFAMLVIVLLADIFAEVSVDFLGYDEL